LRPKPVDDDTKVIELVQEDLCKGKSNVCEAKSYESYLALGENAYPVDDSAKDRVTKREHVNEGIHKDLDHTFEVLLVADTVFLHGEKLKLVKVDKVLGIVVFEEFVPILFFLE